MTTRPTQSESQPSRALRVLMLRLPSDLSPVTLEDFKRVGIDLELFSSKFVSLRSRGSEDPGWSDKTEPMLEILDRVRFHWGQPFEHPTDSEKLVRSAAVNLNVRIVPSGVLSELCLAHGVTPDACILSDRTDFKIDRALYKSNGFTDPHLGGQAGDSVRVRLLRLHSRSQKRLVAIKQVSIIPP